MVTPCPLCHMSLDIYQGAAGRAVKTDLNLPILHLPQLLGLAMGIPARSWTFTPSDFSRSYRDSFAAAEYPHSSLPAEPRT